jgi:hypothetical protein
VAANKKVAHSASLPLTKAMWEYCCEARWVVFGFSLFFFLTAQTSRQVSPACLLACLLLAAQWKLVQPASPACRCRSPRHITQLPRRNCQPQARP